MSEKQISFSVINNSEQMMGLRDAWNNLLSRSSADNVFLTWEFCYTWWQAFKKGKKLTIVLAYNGGCLVGIAPLYRTLSRQFGILSRHQLEFIGGTETFFEGLDFIIDPDRESELIPQFIDFLYSDKVPRWDVMNLTSYRETSKILPQLVAVLQRKNYKNEFYSVRECVVVNFPDTFPEYLADLSSKTRKKSQYYRNRFFKLPDANFDYYNSPPSLKKYYNAFVELHQKRQKTKGNEGSFRENRRKYVAFHNNLIDLLGPLEWVFISFIRVGSKLVSGRYAYNYHDTIYEYSMGFDPEWSEYSPGNVLQFKIFEHLLANTTVRHYDYLRGIGDHKLQWTKNIVKSNDIAIWRSLAGYKIANIERILRTMFKSMLPKSLALSLYNCFLTRDNS